MRGLDQWIQWGEGGVRVRVIPEFSTEIMDKMRGSVIGKGNAGRGTGIFSFH